MRDNFGLAWVVIHLFIVQYYHCMIRAILRSSRFWALALLSVYCLVLSYFRVHRFESIDFLFLIWNLFLAGIPYLISEFVNRNKLKPLSWVNAPLLLVWLLFLPNAPYVLTDVVHLFPRADVPYWYDQMLVLSYALTSLLFGLMSMQNIFEAMKRHYNTWKAWLIIASTSFLAGFGVYLGRYLRWNSWDVLTHPDELTLDILHRVLHPLQHPRTYLITISIGVFLSLIFLAMNTLFKERKAE